MILYHGYAMRWLHPHYMREATIIAEPENMSLRSGVSISSASNEGEKIDTTPGGQLMLMPLSEASKPGLIQRNRNGGRRKTGHASVPGQGPAGETCGSCGHYRQVQSGAGAYRKCALMKAKWTKGPGSDIRKGDPACSRWEAKVAA